MPPKDRSYRLKHTRRRAFVDKTLVTGFHLHRMYLIFRAALGLNDPDIELHPVAVGMTQSKPKPGRELIQDFPYPAQPRAAPWSLTRLRFQQFRSKFLDDRNIALSREVYVGVGSAHV